jgi:septal ring factor EnvC (AmiA/AmiB activator)
MLLNEECQKKIDRRCSESKAIATHEKAIGVINEKMERLLASLVQKKMAIEEIREAIVRAVTDEATFEMRKAFINKVRADKEVELFNHES